MENNTFPLLQLNGICKSFFGVQVLKNVNFDLNAGEAHVLVGENGAGKSTLMKILSAAYTMDSGSILIEGQEQHFHHPQEAQQAGISTVYQHLSQASHLSVAENLFLGHPPMTRYGLVDWSTMRAEAGRALKSIGEEINVDAIVKNLSVAERQIVEIAAAVQSSARILIMDEPTAALSDRETARLFELIKHLKSSGVGIIYISHRLEEISHVGDRVTVLRDGQVIKTIPISEANTATMVSLMVGRMITQTELPPMPEDHHEVLRVEGLTRLGRFEDINFTLHHGEILSLSGLVGAGRTEIAEAIFGAHPATGGQIYVDGKPVVIHHPCDATQLGVGFATEDRANSGLALALSVRENMTLSLLARWSNSLGNAWFMNPRLEKELSNTYAKELDVRAHNLDMGVRYLSGGNQQKVILAKWLMARCRILILDEPTLGIDVGAKDEIYHLMVDFTRKKGGAILVISSDLPEILQISDRILVIANGRLQGELNRAEATEEGIMHYAVAARSTGKE